MQLGERDAVFLTDTVQVEFLQIRIHEGLERCWKIPISLQAYGLLAKDGFERVINYTTFIDFEECKRWYLREGLRYSRDWLRELGLSFKVEGINVAELDAPCQFLLFTHLRFIEKTAERIIAAMPDIERFYVVQARRPLEHEFYFDSDVSTAVLVSVCDRLERHVETIEMESRPRYLFPQFQTRPITDATAKPNNPEEKSGVFRIGFAPATVANAEAIFESLRAHTAQIVLFLSTWNPGLTFAAPDAGVLSAADGHWSERVAKRLEKLYRGFCLRRDRSTLPEAIVRNPRLDYQFAYIIRRRWHAYANMIHHGKRLVRDTPLDLLVQSDHFTAESAVLSRLYRKQGTPVLISLHSDYPCDPNWACWNRMDRALVPTKSAAERLTRISGMTSVFVTGDPALRSYRSLRQRDRAQELSAWKATVADGRKILLILTNALELNCVPFVDLQAHFQSMSELARIANSLKGRVAVALRTKPSTFGEDPVLYAQLSKFFPDLPAFKELSFSESIQVADCIVGLNVATGGYFEIMRTGAPLIHVQLADVVTRQPDLPAQAVITITDLAALRPAIHSILFNEEFRAHALRGQRDYAANDSKTEFAGVDDPVEEVLLGVIKRNKFRLPWCRWLEKSSCTIANPETPLYLDRLRIAQPNGAGSVDDILTLSDRRCVVIGWAADLSMGCPAKAVHIFLNEVWKAQGRTLLDRPDVATAYAKRELLKTGFSIQFPLGPMPNLDTLQVCAELQDGTFKVLSRSFEFSLEQRN